MAQLIIKNPDKPVVHDLTSGVVSVGRHPESNIVVEGGSVSSHHATITAENGICILRDLNSSNGTTVNGQRITEAELHDGDTISFGGCECRFTISTALNLPEVQQRGNIQQESMHPEEPKTQKKTAGLAKASLVLGILIYVVGGQLIDRVGPNGAYLISGIFFAVPAVICGHLARFKISRSPEQLKGGGLAFAGLILGYFTVLGMVGLLVTSPLAHAKKEANRKACMDNMRYLETAKDMVELDTGKLSGDVSDKDLEKYFKDGVSPVCPSGGSYTYNPIGVAPECSIHGKLSDATK